MPEGTLADAGHPDQASAAGGIDPPGGLEVRNLEAQIQAVASGIGITPTTMDVVGSRVAGRAGRILHVEGFPFRFDLTMLPAGPLTPHAGSLDASRETCWSISPAATWCLQPATASASQKLPCDGSVEAAAGAAPVQPIPGCTDSGR